MIIGGELQKTRTYISFEVGVHGNLAGSRSHSSSSSLSHRHCSRFGIAIGRSSLLRWCLNSSRVRHEFVGRGVAFFSYHSSVETLYPSCKSAEAIIVGINEFFFFPSKFRFFIWIHCSNVGWDWFTMSSQFMMINLGVMWFCLNTLGVGVWFRLSMNFQGLFQVHRWVHF